MPVQSIPYILLLGFMYGTTLVASRFSVGQFHPLAYIGIRMTLAGLAYSMFYITGRRKVPRDRKLWRHAIILGIFGSAISMSFIMFSLKYLSSGVVSVLMTTSPVVAVLFAHFFLPDEPLNLRKSLGICLAMGGAFLITLLGETGLPDVSQADPVGYLLLFCGILIGSIMLVYSRKYMKGFSTFDVTTIRILTAAFFLMPLMMMTGGMDFSRVDSTGILVLVYATIVGTFGAILFQFYIIKRFGATAGSMPGYVIPIVATTGGVLLLGETITPAVIIGFLLVFSGLMLINRSYSTPRLIG